MTSSSTDLLGSGVMGPSLMDGDETVTARRSVDERCAEPGLELVEPAPQREERRVDSRVGGVVAEQTGLDQIARGCGLGSLRQEQHERSLLLGQPHFSVVHPDDTLRRVELESPEAIGSR